MLSMAAFACARLFLNHSMPFPHAFHSFISLLLRNVILICLNGWNTKAVVISFLIYVDCRLLFLGHAYPFQRADLHFPYVSALWHWLICFLVHRNSVQAVPNWPIWNRCCFTTLFGIGFPHCNYSLQLQTSTMRTAVTQLEVLQPYISLTWFICLFLSSVEEI